MFKRISQGRIRTAPAINLQDHRPDDDPTWGPWHNLTHTVWIPNKPTRPNTTTPAGDRPRRPDSRKLLGKKR